ncbi:MAG TPA: HAD family phosphatase [Acidobacteriota bacterium]|nr:HAD family phosphatase [Acidobacteriota bacterium]HQM64941.1 HAD family phosphatase [Acidobacteriota bacterium]
MRTAFFFDLDGTVTRQEILPLLSKEIGLYSEMQVFTDATIRGMIPFDSSFKLRCKILNEIPISRAKQLISQVAVNETVVKFIRRHSDQCFIVTGNLDVWVSTLLDQIGAYYFCSSAEHDCDRLIGVRHILNKGSAVQEVKQRGNVERVVAIGDGMNDVDMFAQSDIRIAFGGVHEPVQTLIQMSDIVVYTEDALCRTLNTLL